MDFETLVAGVAIGVAVGVTAARLLGFVGTLMYQVLLVWEIDSGKDGLTGFIVGVAGWLATLVGAVYVYKLLHSP